MYEKKGALQSTLSPLKNQINNTMRGDEPLEQNQVTIPFSFNNTDLRVINQNGEPWFVAKDVASILGYTNTRKATADHCKGAIRDGVTVRDAMGREQRMTIIPERDLYRLIIRSKNPEAEPFEEWVVGEVLPSIRRTGSYGVQYIDFNNPKLIAGLLSQSLQRVLDQDQLLAEFKPKVEALNRIAETSGSFTVTNAAKNLRMAPKKLFKWLDEHNWIYRRSGEWAGHQPRIDQGFLEHKTMVIDGRNGAKKSVTQVRVTPKGLAKLAELLQKDSGG